MVINTLINQFPLTLTLTTLKINNEFKSINLFCFILKLYTEKNR